MRSWIMAGLLAGVAAQAQASDKLLYQPAPAWVKPAPAIDGSALKPDAPILLTYDQQARLADGVSWAYTDVATRLASPEVVTRAGTIRLPWQPAHGDLGSGLVDHSQKMTVAARVTAEKKAVGQRS